MRHPKYGDLRKPQADMVRVCANIHEGGLRRKSVVAIVPPGYGKSLMASIFCHEMLASGRARYVLWVAPKVSLCDQVESGFTNPERGLTRKIGRWDQGDRCDQPPLLGEAIDGYVVTNQTSHDDLRAIVASFRGEPFVVVFDEFHHLADRDADKTEDWSFKANWLCQQPNLVRRLLMSGTPWRHDGYGLPYLDEHRDADGAIVPDIHVTRRDALDEQATLPITFRLFDALVQFDWLGARHQLHLSDGSKDTKTKALATFLDTETIWKECVAKTLAHWLRFRRDRYESRLIVVCTHQDMARAVSLHLREDYGLTVALAISEEADAQQQVQAFRRQGKAQAMVTCRMASEGLDVPDVSHLLLLTNVRTTQFLDQCINRATRVDYECGLPYRQQDAFIFAPADPDTKAYAASVHADQRDLGTEERTDRGSREVMVQPMRPSTFRPIGGTVTREVEGDEDGLLTEQENEVLKRARRDFDHLALAAPREILRFIEAVERGLIGLGRRAS